MNHRSFRIIALMSILICLLAVPGIVTVRAMTPSRAADRTFQPAGHIVAIPRKINTATLKHGLLPPSSSTRTSSIAQTAATSIPGSILPYPPNVVSIPAATATDATAKTGQSVANQPQPDPSGAGGINNYLETVEGGIAAYTRSGTLQLTSTYQSWFNMPSSQFIDPVTVWDDTGDRFIFSVLLQSTSTVLVSVAQQSDATGTYCNYSFSGLANQAFDHLGVDADGIYVSANILSTSGQVTNNELFYASRTTMENCQTVTATYWKGLTNRDGMMAKSIAPAKEDGSTPGVEYLVNSFPTSGACEVSVWTLTSSGSLSAFTVPTQCYNPPPKAYQKGSSTPISTGDCSITQASVVNGLLTFAIPGAYNWNDGHGVVSVIEWFVINPSTHLLVNEGAFGTPGYSLFYPAAVTTSNGKMLFVYSVSSPKIYPSVWYVDETMTDTTALANGTSYYTYSGLSVSPYGAYQSAWPDTSSLNANAVWITGEYIPSTNVWGTKFDLVTPN